jgi:hypothetical protein
MYMLRIQSSQIHLCCMLCITASWLVFDMAIDKVLNNLIDSIVLDTCSLGFPFKHTCTTLS